MPVLMYYNCNIEAFFTWKEPGFSSYKLYNSVGLVLSEVRVQYSPVNCSVTDSEWLENMELFNFNFLL